MEEGKKEETKKGKIKKTAGKCFYAALLLSGDKFPMRRIYAVIVTGILNRLDPLITHPFVKTVSVFLFCLFVFLFVFLFVCLYCLSVYLFAYMNVCSLI